MVLWASILGGLALVIAAVAMILAMFRAERRARRKLFKSLGLPDETIDILMASNGDVLADLALARRSPPTDEDADGPDTPAPAAETSAQRPLPTIRMVHPVASQAPIPGSGLRPYPGRRRRS